MARINVEFDALTDPRFAILGRILGADPATAQAVGLFHAMRVWAHCTQRSIYALDRSILDAMHPLLANGLLTAKLGCMSRQKVYVSGTRGRIEWLNKLRESNRKRQASLRQRNALVTRDNPGAPAPAPAPAQVLKKNPPTPRRAARSSTVYSDGFLKAWTTYPHYGQRSVKRKAFDVWRKAELEPMTDAVLGWIEDAKRTDDWRREEGRFVQGMQVWLKDRDFSDPPTRHEPLKKHEREPLPWDRPNRLLTPEEIEARRQREAGR